MVTMRCRLSALAAIQASLVGSLSQMMGHDLVRPDPERHGALRMTEGARLLRGETTITLRRIPSRGTAPGGESARFG